MFFRQGQSPFSSAFVNALLRFFWVCYRHGLEDANKSGDVGECEEAVERLKDVRVFGTVRYTLDWNEWQFKALQWTREEDCRSRIMDLIMTLRRPKHNLSFLMQIAKMFYMRGLNDWIQCSDWLTWGMIMSMPPYPYLLRRAHSVRPSKLRERFEILQGECFNLIELQRLQEGEAGEYAVPATRIKAFVERVWGAMQKPKWFDDFDVEDENWQELNPTEDVHLMRVFRSKNYTEIGKGKRRASKSKRKKTHRRVSRKDTNGGDATADGSVLQQGAPKRGRGRPPKNV